MMGDVGEDPPEGQRILRVRRDPEALRAESIEQLTRHDVVAVLVDAADDLAELRDYIDWQPFFNAWEMKGSFPDILNNPASGEAARKLFQDALRHADRVMTVGTLAASFFA